MTFKKMLQPPVMRKEPHETKIHEHKLLDDYFWFRNRDNPEVIEHLKKENDYTEEVLSSHKELEKKLFQEMKGRIKEDDESAPFKWGDYFYYTRQEAGKEYTIYCRKRGSLEAQEEILLDVNTIGKKHEYVKVGVFEIDRKSVV